MVETLEAQSLRKVFGQRPVVQDVSFQVKRGQIVGILGPNGAGKTTSFYMTVGLLVPNKGKVLLGNKDITQDPIHKRAKHGIAYLPQNSSVFRKLTVEENLLAVMEVWGVPRHERPEMLEQLLQDFSITHIRKSLGIALSGGERRRLEIARTLVIDPSFLLLDEPFAGIDPVTVGEIQQLITKLVKTRNLGVLITDHNVRETLGVCHFAYILAEGKMLASGDPDYVASLPIVRKTYLGEGFQF